MLTLEELKTWINSLPDTFNEYGCVNGEVGVLNATTKDPENDEVKDEDLVYRCDKPIISMYVDEHSKEICFFHQTQEDVNTTYNPEVVAGEDIELSQSEVEKLSNEDPEEILP